MKKTFYLFLFASALIGCTNRSAPDISGIGIETYFKRFDMAFFNTDTAREAFFEELPALKKDFPYFFMSNETDRFFYLQRKEELSRALFQEVKTVFGSMEKQNRELNQAFKHYYHYYGTHRAIQPITYISNLDFDYPVILADSVVFVATDLYLGVKSKFYANIPSYQAFYRQPDFMVRDAVESLALSRSLKPQKSRLLDDMLFHGKILYFIHRMMPDTPDESIVKYASKDLLFCKENEKSIWAYFIENNLLFDTSLDTKRRFVEMAPFSKFRTKFDNNTPGMIARWVGYEIVKAYMQNNPEYTLEQLMQETESEKILKRSGYKP